MKWLEVNGRENMKENRVDPFHPVVRISQGEDECHFKVSRYVINDFDTGFLYSSKEKGYLGKL